MIEMSLPPSQQVMLPGRSSGAAARSVVGHALLAGLMIIVPMTVFLPAVLLHCGLRNGRAAAWTALGGATGIAAFFLTAASKAAGVTEAATMMSWAELAGVVLALGIPAVLALPLVERGESFGRLVVFLLLGTAVGLAATEAASQAFASFSPYAVQVEQAKATSAEFVELYRSRDMPSDMVRYVERWMGWSSNLLPAMLLVNATLVYILSLLMLGRLKVWREHAATGDGGALTAYLFRRFSLPDWLLFGFVLGGLTPLTTGLLQKVAANVLTIVVFLYILQGLAIFRFLLGALGAGVAANVFGWGLLALLTVMGVGPLLLGVAGLFDSFFDFRHFKKRKDDSHEGHSD